MERQMYIFALFLRRKHAAGLEDSFKMCDVTTETSGNIVVIWPLWPKNGREMEQEDGRRKSDSSKRETC